ncbi:MAG: transposase [Deltaproteobacteria bacterium]|nr:transposase [Deltaproteobacteria bacterium]
MPRQARIDAPGALHHVMCRGIERRDIFRDNQDRRNFVDRLGRVVSETSTSCLAWCLMPNHFHLLLRTGQSPISGVMRRVLTGYAVTFNRKHKRSGHLFQNRYKSILCQEEPYLLELVRYIHLNPLRGGLVGSLEKLDRFEFSGHAVLMGKRRNDWQDMETVFVRFGSGIRAARRGYREFVAEGITAGRRDDLIGGGIIRSSGGWLVLKEMRKQGLHFKSDERILGDSDFVESVLREQEERFERRHRLKARGYNFDMVVGRVAELFHMTAKEILEPSKKPQRVRARSLLCFWAVTELGLASTVVGKRLGVVQSAVSKAVERGANVAAEHDFSIEV